MACPRSSHHQPCCCHCRCCASSCCPSSPHPPAATAAEQLLQAIVCAHLGQSPLVAPQPYHHVHDQGDLSPHYQCPYKQEHAKSQHHYDPQHQLRQRRRRQEMVYQQQQHPQSRSLIETLISRIAALETALPHFYASASPPSISQGPRLRKPQEASSPRVPATNPRGSIRDLAARTIQAHFRQHLVRRSQTLRHLRHLATVRSHVATIKSSLSVSDQARLNPKAVSQRAMDLLHQLDSIQSTDPMIREGKRSISVELVQLLDFADGISARRHDRFVESMEMANNGIDVAMSMDKYVPVVEELAGCPTVSDKEESDEGRLKACAFTAKTARRVNFAENGKGSEVAMAAGLAPPLSEEELTKVWGVEGSSHGSDEEQSPMSGQKPSVGVARPSPKGRPSGSGSPGLSAPLPAQMEPRRDGDSRRKKKVVFV